jgi:AraC family transcriptional regulator
MISQLQIETSSAKLLVEMLFWKVAAGLVRNQGVPSRAPSHCLSKANGLGQRRLMLVVDHIEAHLEEDLSIEALASIACLSPFHFARAFKLTAGRSPHQYVSDRRLERAKSLLSQATQPLVEIALSLNFSSQASFTRAFRKATGFSPGQYRHLHSH